MLGTANTCIIVYYYRNEFHTTGEIAFPMKMSCLFKLKCYLDQHDTEFPEVTGSVLLHSLRHVLTVHCKHGKGNRVAHETDIYIKKKKNSGSPTSRPFSNIGCLLIVTWYLYHAIWLVWQHSYSPVRIMMTSSNGNIFRVTGLCAGNSTVTSEFLAQRPMTRSFVVFFDLLLNKQLNKQSSGWWFEMLSRSLLRHCNVMVADGLASIRRQDICNHPNDMVLSMHITSAQRNDLCILQNTGHFNVMIESETCLSVDL